MLLLLRDGAVLLERRPPTGVWAGLWCLPQIPDRVDIAAVCERNYGAKVEALGVLPAFSHGFTHFTLHIRPRRYRVTKLIPRAESPSHIWLPVKEALGAAIPAPVRRILQLL